MTRRQLIWGAVIAGGGAIGGALVVAGPKLLSMLRRSRQPPPEKIFESSTIFQIGRLSDFGIGVDTQFLQKQRICVVRNPERLYVLYGRCTHMGCTPDWKPEENKFKCPCHGSGFCYGSAFDGDGINCEGPAPRPMDRVHVELNAEGQITVDTGRLYQWHKRSRSEFDSPGAYIPTKQS
jgi:cytochrome b6-f complex iron-sulfur subunit